MASPCEILIQNVDKNTAVQIVNLAKKEALRIEHKFSRFNKNNNIFKINHAKGAKVKIDNETKKLFTFADECYQLSQGMFDISSGVLKKLWNFKKMQNIPSQQQINTCLKNVGWNKVKLSKNTIQLPKGMEIDLGGIGKEYAVDSTVNIISKTYPDVIALVNYGGDLCTVGTAKNAWNIGIEGLGNKLIKLNKGALATSGKTKQFFIHKGKSYSHIINPKSGWPIENSPTSITVLASNTSQAGMLATFAQLKGKNANQFLEEQEIKYWSI